MQKTVDIFRESIVGIRGSTTNVGMIDTIKVDCYGQQMPIKHIALTGKLDRTIFIDPHDTSLVGKITTRLKSSGFDAYQFSKSRILVSVPPISGDEKKKIIKHLNALAEEARVSIRNIRKFCRNALDKESLERVEKQIQKDTDDAISEIDSILRNKVDNL